MIRAGSMLLLTVGIGVSNPVFAQDSPPLGVRPSECVPLHSPDCWRQGEEELMRRWPRAAIRSGDSLVVRLESWGALTFVDIPPRGDEVRRWAFRGVLDASGYVLVDDLRYLGYELWLIHPPSLQVEKLPCWITPSPRETWLYCSRFSVEEEDPRGSVAIYRMRGRTPVLEVRHELGPYRPLEVEWLDDRRVQFIMVPWGGGEGGRQCKQLAEATGWQLRAC